MRDHSLRIETKFKNARLYHAIEEASLPLKGDYNRTWSRVGGGKIKSFCDMHGLSLQVVYQLLNLRMSPLRKVRNKPPRPRVICERLAVLLERDLSWLFPSELYAIKWPTLLVREVDPVKFVRLTSASARESLALPSHQEDDLRAKELSDSLRSSLSTLSPREANVLALRFGLDCDEHTLEEAGKAVGVSKERLRQIESKALRKMRHPQRSRKLEEFLTA